LNKNIENVMVNNPDVTIAGKIYGGKSTEHGIF
jgi:hypothetical protein